MGDTLFQLKLLATEYSAYSSFWTQATDQQRRGGGRGILINAEKAKPRDSSEREREGEGKKGRKES